MDTRLTLSAKEQRSKRWHDGGEPPSSVRTWGADIGNHEHELDLEQTTFTCGAHPDSAIYVNDPHVSSRHALFERRGGPSRGQSLRVIDTDSKNGIRLAGQRLASFDVRAGQPFELARSVTVLPLSTTMRIARLRLFEVYGVGFPDLSLDHLLIASLGSANLLVLGEAGCGHEALARAVHAVSLRRTVPPEVQESLPTEPAKQHELIRRASRSTLILPLKASMRSLSGDVFLEELMTADYQIRVIACAPTLQIAVKMLGTEIVGRMRHILLRPLRTRLDELPQVFDQMLCARASSLRWHHLSAQHQAALQEHPWPDNFDELTTVARFVAAVAPTPTQIVPALQAAATIGVGKTDFYAQLKSAGLSQFWKTLNTEPPTTRSQSRRG